MLTFSATTLGSSIEIILGNTILTDPNYADDIAPFWLSVDYLVFTLWIK